MTADRSTIATLQARSPHLISASLACGALLIVAGIGLAVDPRMITGAPAWLKPAKFCISVIVYLVTLAWVVRDLHRTRALRIAIAA